MIGNTTNKDIMRLIKTVSQDFSQIHDRARQGYSDFQQIAEGSISKVFTAKSKLDKQLYAIKVLNTKSNTYQRAPHQCWDLFMKEIHYLSRFSEHPNIMSIVEFDYDSEYEQAYYVMPYCPNLRQLRNQKKKVHSPRRKPILNTKKLISDCAAALQYVYEKEKIAHENLKLENIFYSEADKRFLVSDWRGFAKNLQMTPRSDVDSIFVAPELHDLSGSFPSISEPLKADVYSLALVSAEASGISLPQLEEEYDYEEQVEELIPTVIELLQANGTERQVIDLIKKMTKIRPEHRCSMQSLLSKRTVDPDSVKSAVLIRLCNQFKTLQADYFTRWKRKAEKQKLLENGVTFAKIIITSINNREHLMRQAFERWRESAQNCGPSFFDRTDMTGSISQSDRALDILAKLRTKQLSHALYRLKFNNTLLSGVRIPPEKRRFLVIVKCLQRYVKDYLAAWKKTTDSTILLSKRHHQIQGSSSHGSPKSEISNSMALALKKVFAKRYIEGFSALKQNDNRFKLLKVCLGRIQEAMKAKKTIAFEIWKGQSTIKIMRNFHYALELENAIRNLSRKMLLAAFTKIKVHGIVDYQKSYLQAIWKWKLSNCEARYYVRQEMFVKRARALAQLIVTLESQEKNALREAFNKIYAQHLRNPADKSCRVKYLAMVIQNKMRKSLWELKTLKAEIDRDNAERKQIQTQAAGKAAKILVKRIAYEKSKWFFRWREYVLEENHLEQKARLMDNRYLNRQKTQAISEWKQMLLRAERANHRRLQGALILKTLVNYRVGLAKHCFTRMKQLFAQKVIRKEQKILKSVEAFAYILASKLQMNQRFAFENIVFRNNMIKQRSKMMAVNQMVRLRKLYELVAMYRYLTRWRQVNRKFNPWFKKSIHRIAKGSTINFQIAFWRLKDSVNYEGVNLSDIKINAAKKLMASLTKHYELELSWAFWKMDSIRTSPETENSNDTFLSEEFKIRGILSSVKKVRGDRSQELQLSDLKTKEQQYEKAKLSLFRNVLGKHSPEKSSMQDSFKVWKTNSLGISKSSTEAPSRDRDLSFFLKSGNLEILTKRLDRLILNAKKSAFSTLSDY